MITQQLQLILFFGDIDKILLGLVEWRFVFDDEAVVFGEVVQAAELADDLFIRGNQCLFFAERFLSCLGFRLCLGRAWLAPPRIHVRAFGIPLATSLLVSLTLGPVALLNRRDETLKVFDYSQH